MTMPANMTDREWQKFVEVGDGKTAIRVKLSDGSYTILDTRYLKLNQTTPQDIINGQPDFLAGLRAGSTNQLSIDASGNLTTLGTLGAGVSTFAGNNGNAAFTLLNLNNNFTPLTTQVGQTSDLVFNLTQKIGAVVSLHEAAKISAYKVSDWFHATTEADTDSGLKFWTTNSGTPTLQLTINEAGLATFAGTGKFAGFQLGTSTTAGYVLTADASGVGTWQSAGAGSQTPWASDIDGAGYFLSTIGGIKDNAATPLLSIDTGNRILYAPDGTTPLIGWDNLGASGALSFSSSAVRFATAIEDNLGSGADSIDTNSRILYGADGTTSLLDWSYNGDGLRFRYGGTYSGRLGSDTEAGYFNYASDNVYLCNGTYAINATGKVYFNSPSSNTYIDGADNNYGLSVTAISAAYAIGAYDGAGNYVTLADQFYAVNAVGASLFTNSSGINIYAIECYLTGNGGGAAAYFYNDVGHEVRLCDEDNNYAINATGDMYISGKITSTGGYDPPYVLYDPQTRDEITTRVADEVPFEKLGGAVLFFNKDTQRLEVKVGDKYYKITMDEI